MAIDTATKRRMAAGVTLLGGVTPNALKDEIWRRQVAQSYGFDGAPMATPDITTGLLCHLAFENNGNDSSGNARHFTAAGTPVYTTGKVGQAAEVTWLNNLNYPTPAWFSGLTAYTVAFWVYDDAYVAGSAALSWGTVDAGASTVIYPYDTNAGNGIRIFNKNNSTAFDVNISKPAIGSWQHITLTVTNATSAELYVNGVSVGTSSADFTTDAALTSIMAGSYHNSNQQYTGLIDELRFYNRVLTSEQIRYLANALFTPAKRWRTISLGLSLSA